MKFTQPKLPYTPDALAPAISPSTVEFHYGKHERAYIDAINNLKEGTEFADMSLEEIIKKAPAGPIYNNASQAWNHIFYFFQFSPEGRREPAGLLKMKIEETFGSFDDLKARMAEAGKTLFGSGWVWLSTDATGDLFISQGKNADNPLSSGLTPILTIDVWEHAYYLDYQNLRADYLKNIWNVVDWPTIENRYREASKK